ncbi:MAG: hypothetical protein ACOCTT_02710 [archaeon]
MRPYPSTEKVRRKDKMYLIPFESKALDISEITESDSPNTQENREVQ